MGSQVVMVEELLMPRYLPAPLILREKRLLDEQSTLSIGPDQNQILSARAREVRSQVEQALAKRVPSALTMRVAARPEVIASGIAELDVALDGGIARGGLTEICGATSSGRTTVLLSLLA